jgi:hypothetical protein
MLHWRESNITPSQSKMTAKQELAEKDLMVNSVLNRPFAPFQQTVSPPLAGGGKGEGENPAA